MGGKAESKQVQRAPQEGRCSKGCVLAPKDEPSPSMCADCPQDEEAGGTEGESVDGLEDCSAPGWVALGHC